MRCDDAKKRLVEYMEGELSVAETAEMREHIDACDGCAAELAAYEKTMLLLEDDGYVEPEPFYWTRFEAGLRAKMRDRSRLPAFMPGIDRLAPRFAPKLAPVVAAVVLFAVGLGVGLQPVLNVVGTTDSAPTYAERSIDDSSPVVSPRSKSLVESRGYGHEVADFAANTADTLRPEGFDTAVDQPQMILATEESWPTESGHLGGSSLGQ